jgi:hypothetical protein
MRAIYPGADPYKNENITFEGVYNLGGADVFVNSNAPMDNLRFVNNDIRNYAYAVLYLTPGEDTDVDVKMAFVANSFGNDAKMMEKASGTDWAATLNLVGSLPDSGFSPVYAGITPTFINNDLA